MPDSVKPLLALATVLFVVGLGLFLYMRGPANLIAQPPRGSAVGYPILDRCLTGYTHEDVDRRLAVWRPDQIATYQAIHLGPDMLFPWVYAGFFFVTALLVYGVAFPGRTLWPWLLVLPLLVLVADYTENYLISFVILPAGAPSDPATVAWASRVTVAKWVLVALNGVVLVVGGLLALRARRQRTAPGGPPRPGSESL
jgi:hypothetical protein